MTDWSAGYVADIGYTYGYYTELNPTRLALAFLNAGLVVPKVGVACELGFGQGPSANLHAAASVTTWHGTDFNPAQAGFAQELARGCGSGAQLVDQSFADFCQRPDLPEFDFIGLHGIWSWISDDNRRVIVDFVHRRLKVGGVLYISYNTLPGWAAFAPMRHLMTEHAETLGAEGRGIVNRIEGAIEFADRLLATNPAFSRANPQVGERLKRLKEQNRHYLAHEYFNRDWHPMHFATLADWLAGAKMQFACSANPLDTLDALNLTTEQQAFLHEIPDPLFRQSVRDFMVNQQFRKDYWVKGARRLDVLSQVEQLRAQPVVLTRAAAEVPPKVNGALGEVSLTETVYQPILQTLSDHRPRTLAQLEQSVAANGLNFAQVWQAVLVLIGAGHVSPAQDEATIAKAKQASDRLNAQLLQHARSSHDISYLASPVTGGGIAVGRFQQLFLLAQSQGHKRPEDWARFVWDLLSRQGQRILKDGQPLDSAEDNLAELSAQAQTFGEQSLPLLRALQIA